MPEASDSRSIYRSHLHTKCYERPGTSGSLGVSSAKETVSLYLQRGTVCVTDSGAVHQKLPNPLIRSFLQLELATAEVIP